MVKKSNDIWTRGSRKTSIARVRLVPGSGKITINKRSVEDFFGGHIRQKTATLKPLTLTDGLSQYDIIATVKGGGPTGQAGALSLGISRAAAQTDEKVKRSLRKEGFLTRDSRMVERKKPGQPKARKKFQYSKR